MLTKFCNHRGCKEIIKHGERYCEAHQQDINQHDKFRGSSSSRGYDYKWQQFRLRYLRANQLCLDCLKIGLVEPAVDVHHIHKLRDGGKKLDPKNCMALCHECHAVRTNRGE